ncbi:MAG: complex I NDUFA9 subunit family protein [Methylophilaceae bacterium]
MQNKTICVLGGSGFIGSHIVHHLDKAGFNVKVLTRRRESSKHLILLPKVTVVECQIMSDMALRHVLSDCDTVINLVGILHQDKHTTFEAIHGELPRRLVALCKELNINRLIQMSALHASSAAPSMYLRSKAMGEAALKVSQLNWTIFRPSVVFGEGDSFLNLFANMAKLTPIIPLAVPNARFQPLWVEDLAHVITASVNDLHTYQQSYDLCGPTVYTMRELVAFAANAVGANPRIIGLNKRLSYLQAAFMEWLPIKLMSRDNLLSTEIDSVSAEAFPTLFGITPAALEAIAPDYLSGATPRANYLRYRVTAGR